MDTTTTFRRTPFNFEAEQALLGAILINNDAMERVSDFLEAEHFFDPLHQQIYDTAAKLIASGKQATPVTLRTFFETAEPIDAGLTVTQYLGRLAANSTTIINARDYGRTVYDLATRRQLIIIGEDVVNAAYDSPVDFPPKEQIEEAEARLYALAEVGKYGGGDVRVEIAMEAAVKEIENVYRNKMIAGLSTGFRDLDAKVTMRPSNLIIVAGRPSMGKTSLVTNIMRRQQSVAVQFFSLEMSAAEISEQLLSEEAGIPTEKLLRGGLDEEDWRKVVAAQENVSKLRLRIDDTGGLSIGQLSARARRGKRRHGTELIVIDYLQLMTGTKKRDANNRVQEVAEITVGLKALAKELKVPVIALSQLSRNVEHRSDKRPQLSDLRESGSIEQDADVVLFVYREDYYEERQKPTHGTPEFHEWLAKMEKVKGKAEVIIGKQRRGPIGTVELQFEASCTRFSNLESNGRPA